MVSGVYWATLVAAHDSIGDKPAGRTTGTVTVHFPQAATIIAQPSVSRVIQAGPDVAQGPGLNTHEEVIVFVRRACGLRPHVPCVWLTPEDAGSQLFQADQISNVTFEIQVASMNRRVEGFGTGLVFLLP
jgi:hypothetical protein